MQVVAGVVGDRARTSDKFRWLTGAVSAYSLVGHIYTFLKCYLDGCIEEPTLSSMARVVGSILSGDLELVSPSMLELTRLVLLA